MTGERTLNPDGPSCRAGWRASGPSSSAFFDFDGRQRGGHGQQLRLDRAAVDAIEFLRDVGKHFSVNRMLDREAVAARLAAGGISYTEFCYQLLQSYDYVQLFRRYGCRLQTGGSDQWGNITAGVDLVRRMDGEPRARAHHPADHQGRRHQVRQDRDAARSGWTRALTSAVRLLPVLGQRRRPRRRVATCGSSASARGTRSRRSSRRRRDGPPRARPSGPSPTELTTLVHGAEETAAVARQRRARCSARATSPRCRRADAGRGPGRGVRTCGPGAGRAAAVGRRPAARTRGSAPSRAAARRTVAEGGAYLNNVRVTRTRRTCPRRRDAACTAGGWCCGGQAQRRGGRGGSTA